MDELAVTLGTIAKNIPDHISKTARAVMVGFVETQPDAYVARLEVFPCEWMTISDDSLSDEVERELLTSAVAMCFWGGVDDLVSRRTDQRLHRCLREDRAGVCARAGRPLDYRVATQINTETHMGVIARERRFLTRSQLRQDRLRGAGAQMSAEFKRLADRLKYRFVIIAMECQRAISLNSRPSAMRCISSVRVSA